MLGGRGGVSREPLLTLPGKRTTLGDNVIKAVFKKKRTVNVFEKQSKRKQGGLKKIKELDSSCFNFPNASPHVVTAVREYFNRSTCVGDRTR